MGRHAKVFAEKQKKLQEKESQLRADLDNESEKAEKKLIKVLKSVGYIGAGLVAGYLIYRFFFRSKKIEKPKKKKSKPAKKRKKKDSMSPVVSKFYDKLLESILKMALERLKSLLRKPKGS